MSATPETDAAADWYLSAAYSTDPDDRTVPLSVSRKLERERDEAREQRDSLQALSQSLAETCVKLKAERDEARAELDRLGWRLTS
jgi:multidrug resistance efflux pump